MAVVKTYAKYTCTNCGKTSQTKQTHAIIEFGNPLYSCRQCGAINYDSQKKEAAFMSVNEINAFDKDQLRTLLFIATFFGAVLSFFPFLLLTNNTILSFVAAALIIAALDGALIMKIKKKNVDIHSDQRIAESLKRLRQDRNYTGIIKDMQGIASDSAWRLRGFCINCFHENGAGAGVCRECETAL